MSETAEKRKGEAFFEPRRMTQENIVWMEDINGKGKNEKRPWS